MKILSLKERKDGSANMTYQLSKKDEILFRKAAEYAKVRYSKKFANQLILNALELFLKIKKEK